MNTRLLRRLGILAVAGGVLLLLFAALYLAASAEGLGNRFAGWYPLVFVGAGLAVVLLALAIGARLLKLRAQLRAGVPGARLTRRLLLLLVLLALPPIGLVYGFAVRFVGTSVDTWLRASTPQALDAALEIARLQLEERREDALARSGRVLQRLVLAGSAYGPALEETLDAEGALQLALFDLEGRLRHVAAAEPGLLLPAPPSEAARLAVEGTGREFAIERIDGRSHARVLLRLPREPLLLQALFALPTRQLELAEQIEAAAFGTRQALFLRDALKQVFVLILSLVALLSMFMAVLIAFDLARRLVAPIARLAEATRAVASGRLEPVPGPLPGDELGFLVESFNRMTDELAHSQAAAADAAAETERQRAFLATVLARLSSAVLALDAEGRLRGANAAAAELCGLDIAALQGLRLAELGVRCGFLAPLTQLAAARLAEQAPEWRQELAVEQGGERRLLMLRGASLPEGGQLLVIDDTTAIDRARRDAAWSEVARRLAHEVKNPLTPIQLSAERLRRRVLPQLAPAEAEVLDRATHTIVAQVDALKTLVNAFGEYARPPQLQLQPLDLNALVAEVLELYEQAPGLRLERALDPALPPLCADAGRLRQVLHNLLKNAQEAAAERPALCVCVLTRLREDVGKRWVELGVEDDGPGLPEGFSSDWFEPYRSSKPRGTGLGLAISRKIADEHAGQLLAENRAEGGARFLLRLPL
ncbi:MAG: HAMP domain-containing protein [Aquimonas sp.]|nr:HAMP domain-containing protein [Aquimonas sp.]